MENSFTVTLFVVFGQTLEDRFSNFSARDQRRTNRRDERPRVSSRSFCRSPRRAGHDLTW